MKSEFKTFDDVREYLNTIPAINYGGCGISALAMYRWLKNNDEIKEDTCFVYVYLDDNIESYRTNKMYLDNGCGELTSCSHCVLWHNGEHYDSEGIECLNYYDYSTIIDEDFLIKSINTKTWNPEFNRFYVCEIEKELGIDLSDISLDFKSYDRNTDFNEIEDGKNFEYNMVY